MGSQKARHNLEHIWMQNYRNTVLGKAYIKTGQVFLNYIPQSSIHGGTLSILQMFGLNFIFFKMWSVLDYDSSPYFGFLLQPLSLRIQFSVDLVLCCA